MKLEQKYLYYPLLRNHLDRSKYPELSESDRLVNILFILDDTIHYGVSDFIEKLCYDAPESEIDLNHFDLHRRYPKPNGMTKLRHKMKNHEVRMKVQEYLEEFVHQLEKGFSDSELARRAEFLRKAFELPESDLEWIFGLIILRRADRKLSELPIFEYRYQFSEMDKYREPMIARQKLALFMGHTIYHGNSILNNDSLLVKSGLVEKGRGDTVGVSDTLYDYFTNDSTIEASIHQFETKDDPIFTLDSFSVDKSDIALALALLKSLKSCSILFVGEPGTSKTQLSRALAKEAGLECLFIPNRSGEEEEGLQRRKTALGVAALTMKNKVIVLDEADDVIHTSMSGIWKLAGKSNSSKAWLNDLLDNNQSKLIAITNHDTCDPSTLRRFSMILKFKKLGPQDRLKMIKNTLIENGASELLSIDELKALSEKTNLTQGNIALAIKDAMALASENSLRKEIFLGLIKNKYSYFSGKTFSLEDEKSLFDPALIKTSEPVSDIEDKIRFYLDENGKRWKPDQCALLFHGASGCGKTAFAEYLAKKFNRKLISLSSTSLLDMYVGGTERKIREVFETAEHEKAFLFLDEIDGLVKGRSKGDKRYELSTVNEFMVSIEKYRGVFMAATNFSDVLDPALDRRFQKVEFYLPDVDTRFQLVKKYFHDQVDIDDEKLRSSLEPLGGLTPGLVKLLKHSLAFKEHLSLEELITELSRLCKSKKTLGLA